MTLAEIIDELEARILQCERDGKTGDAWIRRFEVGKILAYREAIQMILEHDPARIE